MSAPWIEGESASSLLAAVGIGAAFGAALERAGLGSARKLIGQFFVTDLAVFKVMFSAVVTALLGAFWLDAIGVLDLARVAVPDTWIVPQLVGGLIFGAGMALGGLCPGTSCVAAATGRGDGVAVMLGMLVGVLVSATVYERLRGFIEATPGGALTVPAWLGLPRGVVVLAVVALALAGFRLAERVEGRA